MTTFDHTLRDLNRLERAVSEFIMKSVARAVRTDTRRRHVHQYGIAPFRQYVLLPIARKLDLKLRFGENSHSESDEYSSKCFSTRTNDAIISFVRRLLIDKAPRDLRFSDAAVSVRDVYTLICSYLAKLLAIRGGLSKQLCALRRDSDTLRFLSSSSSSSDDELDRSERSARRRFSSSGSSSSSSTSSSSLSDETGTKFVRVKGVSEVKPAASLKSILKGNSTKSSPTTEFRHNSTRKRKDRSINLRTASGAAPNYISVNVNCCCSGRPLISGQSRIGRSRIQIPADSIATGDGENAAAIAIEASRRVRRGNGGRSNPRRRTRRSRNDLGRFVTAITDVTDELSEAADREPPGSPTILAIENVVATASDDEINGETNGRNSLLDTEETDQNVVVFSRQTDTSDSVADAISLARPSGDFSTSHSSSGTARKRGDRKRKDIDWLLSRVARRKTVPGYDPADHPSVNNKGPIDKRSIGILKDSRYREAAERVVERRPPSDRNILLFDNEALNKWRDFNALDPSEAQLARMRLTRNEFDFLLRVPYLDNYTAGLFVRSPEELALSRDYFSRSRLVPDAKQVYDPRYADNDEEKYFDALVQRKIRQSVNVINIVPPDI